jgi:3,4-dihydroxy 2-butanone 4-phosphate synthase / GTP cyclohydrolase II
VLVLLNCEQRSADLIERVAVPQRSRGPIKMDLLTYGIGAQILRDVNVRKMRLMATNMKLPSLAGWSLEIAGYEQPQRMKVK